MLVINGKRWFDGTNTYHSVEIYEGKKRLVRVKNVYGYDDAYQQTAYKELILMWGYEAMTYQNFLYNNLFIVADVCRKKDL